MWTPEQRQIYTLSLTDEEFQAVNWWYVARARDKQCPPEGEWFCWLLRSGRGFGKTRTGGEWVLDRIDRGSRRIALVGQTVADVRDTMIETEDCSLLNISPPWFMPEYEPSKRRLTWPNGAVATTYSGDKPDQLRGPQHDTAWVDELAKFKYPQDTWDNLEFGLRIGEDARVCITTTPRPVPIIKGLLDDPMVVDIQGSTYENIDNLAPSYRQRILARYDGTYLGRQEIYGELLEDRPGALWDRKTLEENRVQQHPRLTRIVVGVDPTGGVAETGIIVAGVGEDKHGYVLDDRSLEGKPNVWGSQAVSAYHRNAADRIVGEVNFGGEMVESTIRTADRNVSYKNVRASKGKTVRAEPVSALYEQGRVHHVGNFADLEDELCTWVQGEGMPSPNRLDALVWALTELMLSEEKGPVQFRRYA